MTVTSALPLRKRSSKRSDAPTTVLDEDEEEQRYKPIDLALVRRMLGLLVPYRWQYALGVILGATQVTLEMQSPKFTQAIIDHCSAWLAHVGRAPGAAVASAPPTTWIIRAVSRALAHTRFMSPVASPAAAIAAVAGIILLWGIITTGSVILQRYTILVMTRAGERVQFSIRRQLFAHLQELSMSYYDKTKLGRIISRCTSDVNALREINVWGLHTIVANSLMMGVAAFMLATTDLRLFLSVAPLGVALFVCNRIYIKKAAGMWQTVREGWTRVSTNMAENITGMRVVTAYHRQAPNLAVFDRLQEANTNNNVRMSRVNGVYLPLLDLIGFIGKVVILAYGGYLIISGKFSDASGADLRGVGAVVAAYLYWDWFMGPIRNFGNFYNLLLQAMAGGERVFNLLDMPADVQDVPGAAPLGRIQGRVSFDHVTFGYDPDRPVLHDVCFDAVPGQMIALVGATGSGKSSIISLIARFYQPQQGRVLVDGHDIRLATGDSLHRQMGLVLQVNYLFSGTVMENIRYARADATEAQVIEAAREIGSYDSISSLSDGFHSQVGERGGNMSLGQRQLICFTRAYLANPRIFMLDEATSAVDTATELAVQRSLEKLLAGRTTFVVAHRLSTIMRADMILVIEAGKIIERGTHRRLLEAGGKYAHLYEQFVTQSE
jgi:ATP-binding cassette subfamily B protein